MKPSYNSKNLIKITHSKAKMYEYKVPEANHVSLEGNNPSELFSLMIGMIGDFSHDIINDINTNFSEKVDDLKAVADFLDTYIKTKLSEELDSYLLLVASATFYLSNQQGSSNVLIKELDFNLDLNSESLDILIYWLLKSDYSVQVEVNNSIYKDDIISILEKVKYFFQSGEVGEIFEELGNFRRKVYEIGSYREILFIDIIFSLIKVKYKNSTWLNLPYYSNLPINQWREIILKDSFIKEFWQSQHLLGENDVYKGKSAVIQLPTSAGKTKSTEIIIRSSFLAERSSIAIIVAPFRALCNEIKNDLQYSFNNEDINVDEFSDVLQVDVEIDDILESENKSIFVSTPEKLYYLLKQYPEIASKIGLLIYDEGHQFDSGTRGVVYELLVSSLKKELPNSAQVILISAVISNAEIINSWLTSNEGVVISGNNIKTNRSIAFTSWTTELGQLKFINKENTYEEAYFVPRVLSQESLAFLSNRETRERKFPEKNNNGQVATYLALNLIDNGSVAIFIPRQSSINTLSKDINEAYRRNLTIEKPLTKSDDNEVRKIFNLYQKHLGENNEQTKLISLGLATHHGNLPDSIKLSVEYALQESFLKIVLCTSTLAQGVNLPIKYLIVTGVYQGKEQIKVRDFHNLIGRSGRAGKYTEGSIIFADKDIYDKKTSLKESWRWDNAQELLNSSNSEDIESNILDIFSPIVNIPFNNVDNLLVLLYSSREDINGYSDDSDIRYELYKKRSFLLSVENFLIENYDRGFSNLEELASYTLAYHLADDDKKQLILELFRGILLKIQENNFSEIEKKVYSKTLFGVAENKIINTWLDESIDDLVLFQDNNELELALWQFIKTRIKNKVFTNFSHQDLLDNIFKLWIKDKSYHEILEEFTSLDIRIIAKSKRYKLTVDHIVQICEKAISFEGTLVLSSIIEFLKLYEERLDTADLEQSLKVFQKKMKYGLNSMNAIITYELGFNDRFLSNELAGLINENSTYSRIKRFIKNDSSSETIIDSYPSYYKKVLRGL